MGEAGAEDPVELARLLAGGDAAALERAYKLYGARCNAIAHRILLNDESARDAVQEAFLSLWRHREGLVVRTAGVAPWLFVVTRNAALGILRKESARARRESRVEVNSPTETFPDPAELVSTRSDIGRLQHALRELPLEQQSALKLAYFNFLTMAQIAEQTSTPIGTVKRRIQIGLRHLGKLLSEGAS